jgi:murein DD-endopeptidase MepM/ murein hydrolase activator NlpD
MFGRFCCGLAVWLLALAAGCLGPAVLACTKAVDDGGQPLQLAPPSPHPVGASFGPRLHPVLGFVRMHAGVDYEGPLGDPVAAAASGVIQSAKWDGEYGNRVVIDHGGGFATSYSHLARFAMELAVGACVEAGSAVGFVGKSFTCTSI